MYRSAPTSALFSRRRYVVGNPISVEPGIAPVGQMWATWTTDGANETEISGSETNPNGILAR